MASAEFNGTRLEYHELGRGEPVVLVHGSATDYRTWDLQREAFAEHHRVIDYSRRFHWPNQPIEEGRDYSMAEQVSDLEALLRSLDAAPAHLVGHSYGAFLCLLVAMNKPSLIRTLALAEPPAITLFVSADPKPLEILRLLVTRPRTAIAIIRFGLTGILPAKNAFRKGDLEGGVRAFGDATFGRGGYDRLSDAQKAQVRDNLGNAKAELLGSGFLPLDPEALRTVAKPTLLITGENSVALFHRVTDRLEELLPRTERIEVSEASHAMNEDNAADYNAAVLSFIEKHGGNV
ncbi:MAG: alpha/beta hydrolase [Acidobacteria bacterium]|nr:alpha/beta hydrolase [Acidobacteriota bacterium]